MSELALTLGQIFNGFSIASIYVLAALGLALSFGLMRVINMAHGEMLMVGGYIAYLTMQMIPGPLGILAAIPVAFLGAFALGAVLESTIIHRLSARPLDTLLATWGISLVLQQGARSIFGAIGVDVNAPAWLNHSVSFDHGLLQGLSFSEVRVFIIVLALLVLIATGLLLTRTRLGLLVRAVNQDRATAEAMGVNARRVDLLVFSLGTGVAGLAGVVLGMLAPVTPDVGQSYIVQAFLVVIVGGVGSIVGAAIASLVLGIFFAMVQLGVDVSMAQVLMLLFVIIFLQFRPQGVIAMRSRVLDA